MLVAATKEMSCMQCATAGPWMRRLKILRDQVRLHIAGVALQKKRKARMADADALAKVHVPGNHT